MKTSLNPCACPNVKCKRHGNCELCKISHKNKTMYCKLKSGSFHKWIIDKIFRAAKK